jgi:hypothetical protein
MWACPAHSPGTLSKPQKGGYRLTLARSCPHRPPKACTCAYMQTRAHTSQAPYTHPRCTLGRGSGSEAHWERPRPAGGGWGCEPVGADRPTKTSCSGLQGVPRAARMHPTPRAQACRSSDQRSEALQPFGARLRDRWAHSRTGAGRLVQERNENVSCVCSKHAHESQLDNTIEQALMQLAERMPSMKHEHARARAQRKRI